MNIKFILRELWAYGPTQEFVNRKFKSDKLLPMPWSHIYNMISQDFNYTYTPNQSGILPESRGIIHATRKGTK